MDGQMQVQIITHGFQMLNLYLRQMICNLNLYQIAYKK